MKLGLRRGTVALEPHNTEWERTAMQTIAKLRELLPDVIIDAQHIGSTAIKGISAKPIIDIVIGVADFDDILSHNDILGKNGFIFREQDIPSQYLYVCGDNEVRTHHIHAVICGSAEWNNYINMRDYLNCHKADASAYSELKQKIAQQYPNNRIKYTDMKSSFINDILIKAQKWRKEKNR